MERLSEILKGIDLMHEMGLPVPFIWNDKHIQIRDCKSENLICYGGRDSAKSHSIAQKFVIQMEQTKYYFKGLMVRKHYNAIKDSQFETIKQIIYDSGKANDFFIRNHIYEFEHRSTGLKTVAKGLDKPDKMKSMKDPTMIWFEEPNTDGVTLEDYIKTTTSLRGARAEYFQCIFSLNSDDGENWIKEHFFPEGLEWENDLPEKYLIPPTKPDTTILHFTYHDNYFVTPQSVKKLEGLKEIDEDFYNIFTLGKWGGKTEDIIISNFEVIPDEEYESYKEMSNDVFYGVDWGFNDPQTLTEMFVLDQDVYVKELYYKSGKLPKDMIEFMKEKNIDTRDPIYPDPSRPDSKLEVSQAGYNVHKADNDILDGLKSVKSHKLHISDASPNILKERRFYKWQKDKEDRIIDKPIDLFNHAWDGIRYGIHNHPTLKYSRERMNSY